jgi:hypothetical protein
MHNNQTKELATWFLISYAKNVYELDLDLDLISSKAQRQTYHKVHYSRLT